jgi:hypothetical protein
MFCNLANLANLVNTNKLAILAMLLIKDDFSGDTHPLS